jgi:hypothetical protein
LHVVHRLQQPQKLAHNILWRVRREQHVSERDTLTPSRVEWVHAREQTQCSEHHLVQVLLAEGVKDLQGRGLNRLDTAVSKEHQAQVRPLRVLGVGEHGSSRAGVGNTLVPKRDHLVQRRRSVAHLTKGLPQNAGKTLPV